MEKFKAHLAASPALTKADWAEIFGISRPYLYDLISGARNPSSAVARRIELATGGAVPVADWPNIKAVLDAAGVSAN